MNVVKSITYELSLEYLEDPTAYVENKYLMADSFGAALELATAMTKDKPYRVKGLTEAGHIYHKCN